MSWNSWGLEKSQKKEHIQRWMFVFERRSLQTWCKVLNETNSPTPFPPVLFPFFPPLFVSSVRPSVLPVYFQAQARFNESSQKLDLLRYSLEQRLSELPKNHPRSSSIVEELSLLSSPVLSPRSSIISAQNQYSTVTKPAALTGNWSKEAVMDIDCTLIVQMVNSPLLKSFRK